MGVRAAWGLGGVGGWADGGPDAGGGGSFPSATRALWRSRVVEAEPERERGTGATRWTVAAPALSSPEVVECVGVSALCRTSGTCSGPFG